MSTNVRSSMFYSNTFSETLMNVHTMPFRQCIVVPTQRAISIMSRVLCLIPARFYTFVEINHERFSMAILHHPVIQEGLVPVTSESMYMKYCLTAKNSLLRKNVIRLHL